MRIVPPLGSTTPPSTLIKVDLPAPFSPIRPMTSPGDTARLTLVERDHAGIGLADVDEFEKVGSWPVDCVAGATGPAHGRSYFV